MQFGEILRKEFILNSAKSLFRYATNRYSTALNHLPNSMQIDVTTKCNLACSVCGREVLNKEDLGKDMSMETYSKLVPYFKYMRDVRLFSYGESFMNPNFMTMLEIAKKERVGVIFHTNGMLLSEERISRLVELKIDSIIFSFDGATPSTFEGIRLKSRFETVVNNLVKLREEKERKKSKYPIIEISYNCMKDNIDEIAQMIDLAKSLKVSKVHFQNIIAYNQLGNEQSLYKLEKKYVQSKYDEAIKRASELGVNLGRMPSLTLSNGYRICGWPWHDLYVRWDGGIVPCCYIAYSLTHYYHRSEKGLVNEKVDITPPIMGNVTNEPLGIIWNNERFRKMREEFVCGKPSFPHDICIFPYGIH